MAEVEGDRMNPGLKILPLPKCQLPSRRADERIEVMATCPLYEKLSLKADEPQGGQRHEDVERKRE